MCVLKADFQGFNSGDALVFGGARSTLSGCGALVSKPRLAHQAVVDKGSHRSDLLAKVRIKRPLYKSSHWSDLSQVGVEAKFEPPGSRPLRGRSAHRYGLLWWNMGKHSRSKVGTEGPDPGWQLLAVGAGWPVYGCACVAQKNVKRPRTEPWYPNAYSTGSQKSYATQKVKVAAHAFVHPKQ